MSEEPSDIERQRLKAVTEAMGEASRAVENSMRNVNSGVTESDLDLFMVEMHRRGLPKQTTFRFMTWPLGVLNYGIAQLQAVGLKPDELIDAVDIIISDRFDGEFADDTLDKLRSEFDLHCQCSHIECGVGDPLMFQAMHAISVVGDIFLAFHDMTQDECDEYIASKGKAERPHQMRFESAKQCIEFLAMFVINSSMTGMII